MKISEMNNEQAVDTFVRIAAPLGNICDDDRIAEMLTTYKAMDDTPMIKVIGKFLPEIIGIAFKDHRQDVFEIVGALTFQSKEKAAKMNFMQTIKVIREALSDEDLVGFFTSLKKQTGVTEGESAQG